MNGDPIDPNHHLIRNVTSNKLRRAVQDDGTEVVVGFLYTAFVMRPVDDYLSATWQESFPGTPRQQLEAAVRAIRASNLEVRSQSAFAVGKAEAIREACGSKGHQVRIIHEPEPDNAGHASVRRYPRDETELFELLAAEAWSGLVMNSDVP